MTDLPSRSTRFQPLEHRIVLDAMSWIGGSGNWDASSNWVDNTTPGHHATPQSGDTVTIDTGPAATITIKSGDSINLASVTTAAADTLSMTGGSLTLSAGASVLAGPLDMTGGTLEATGNTASLTANNTTTVSQANLSAENGAIISLPGLNSTVSNGTFQANGAGSILDVSQLTTVIQQGGWTVNAGGGGKVNLSGLTSLTGTQGINFNDNGGSTILDPNLTSLTKVNFTSDGSDVHVADAWTKFLNGSLSVTGGSYSLPGLIDVDQSSLHVSNGGSLTLPNLTSYLSNGTFEATGKNTTTQAPSVLNLSGLTTLTQAGGWTVNVGGGGEVNLSGLTSLTGTQGINFNDNGGSTILDPNLTSLAKVNFTTDGSDLHVADAWTKFLNGSLSVTGGSYNLPGLIDVDQSSLHISNGGSLTLPSLTSYVSNGTFEANGKNTITQAPSVLNVSGLTTLTQAGGWTVNAGGGGEVNLSGLTSLTSTHGIDINDTGNSTLLDPKLTTLTGVSYSTDGTDATGVSPWVTFTGGTLTVNTGTLTLPAMVDFANSTLSLSNGAALVFPALTQGSLTLANGTSVTVQGTLISMPAKGASGAVINFPASQSLTFTLDNMGTLSGGTTFNVGAGTAVALNGGTYLGGATFNLSNGSTIDLTGGNTTSYGGTLVGTGGGTISLGAGNFYPADGGATLNFPGKMFQWTGGAMELSVGDVTNQGTINLSGSNETQIYADGTLDDFGTIIQTGTGDFGLHSDNISPTTLKIEAGGQYLMESDAGINNLFFTNLIENAGTIAKKAGTGTSTIEVNGQLINTGTIEAESGTLDLEPSSFAQIDSNGTLTGGTWNALNGATIKFHSGTSITGNAANVTLDGSGAAMPALALASNSGTLASTGGASLSTPGDFSNSGTLTLGGTLNVGGNFTQTSAGTLNEQVGGSPTSGQFGQMVATDTATLAGNFYLSLANGFMPVAGQNYPVLKYTRASGSFAMITGLVSGMTANQNATEFDLDMPGAPADLSLSGVTESPNSALDGQQITVDWQVTDVGAANANGSWVDSVYLSTTPAITASSILLGSVTHTGGLTAGNSYNASLSEAAPALAPGDYYVLVETDSHFQVADANRTNNMLAATTGQLAVSVPSLTPGTPASGTFTEADQDQYYQVTVPAGGTLVVTLISAATSGATELYVSQGAAPTPFNFQIAASANQPNQTLSVPNASGGTYYFLIHSVSGAAATAGYTLTVSQTSALDVSATSLSSGGNAGNVTVEVDGTNFEPSATASLTLGATTIAASAIDYVNSGKFFATFNLTGATAGSYSFNVEQGAQSVAAPTPFQVVSAVPGALQLSLILPQFVRSGRTSSIVATYTNTTGNDIPAPLLTISSTNVNVLFSSPADPSSFAATAQIVIPDPNGPSGVIPPGQSGQLTFTLLSNDTIDGDVIPVQLTVTPHNMASVSPASQPLKFDPLDAGGGGEGSSSYSGDTTNRTSHDPNAVIGPSGYGTQQFIKPQGALPYTLDFENDGSVAAQDVTITQQLDSGLDWSSFQLGSFGFGPMNLSVPAGLTEYEATVSYHNADGSALNVDVEINFNVQVGLLTASFISIDPTSGQPPTAVNDGFLPPDDATGIGEGFVEYTVHPKTTLNTGTTIDAAASVVFDINAPLSTKTVSNTIDAGAPTSGMVALPTTETSSSFTVSWSGADDTGGSGIASYSVFVSDNGGPFTAFETDTTATSAVFNGVNGHSYAFYSVATDNVGNVQPMPRSAQVTTTVDTAPPAPTANPDTLVFGPTGPYSASGTTSVLANDTSADGQPQNLVAILVSQPTSGTLTLHADGSFTYMPGAGFQGIDRFSYQVSEGGTLGNTVTVTLLSYDASLVDKLYNQVLHRSAEDSGLIYWTSQLDAGQPLDVVATGIFNSTERLNPLVTQFYEQYLDRNTDPSGLNYWVTDWQTKGDPRDVVENILASQEFFDDAGDTNSGYITLLYQRVLQRPAESSGLAYWVGLMSSPTNETRLQVASQFYDTHEKHTDLVDFLFGEYFQGATPLPDTAPYVTDLDNGETETQVEKAIIDSSAYSESPPEPAAGTVGRALYPR
ncbi:MAG TPA: DUF4214 domain-containing protein [Pirellulales bacterium]|nr:DUF4214 domain-containing protein [Pirellulales bacterium]